MVGKLGALAIVCLVTGAAVAHAEPEPKPTGDNASEATPRRLPRWSAAMKAGYGTSFEEFDWGQITPYGLSGLYLAADVAMRIHENMRVSIVGGGLFLQMVEKSEHAMGELDGCLTYQLGGAYVYAAGCVGGRLYRRGEENNPQYTGFALWGPAVSAVGGIGAPTGPFVELRFDAMRLSCVYLRHSSCSDSNLGNSLAMVTASVGWRIGIGGD